MVNLLFCLFFSLNIHAAEPLQLLEEFDLRSYHPEGQGLKDLVYEVRSPELLKELSTNQALGKIVDVYLKVYWIYPGNYKLQVEGLPKGFSDIEEMVKNHFLPSLQYVIPENFAPKFKNYKLSSKVLSDKNIQINGNDESGMNDVLKVEVILDSGMRPKTIKTESIHGKIQTDLAYSVKSWSKNKWVADHIVTMTNKDENAKTSLIQSLKYEIVSGFGFPKKLISIFKSFLSGKLLGNEIKKTFNYSNFEVNSGKAAKVISK